MKERPILFNDEMVRAILAGRKTQTRRALKPQPKPDSVADHGDLVFYVGERRLVRLEDRGGGLDEYDVPCPYGAPGDRLWVKEAFCYGLTEDGLDGVCYRATNDFCCEGRWRPSIHMPGSARRITLEVVSVRVERVQEISEEDAQAEGAEQNILGSERWYPEYGFRTRCVHYPEGCECFPHASAREWYAELWDSINGKGSWASNPWVWAVEFRRVGGFA